VCVCVCVCVSTGADNNFWTTRPLTQIFTTLVPSDPVQVRFKGEGYRSKFTVTGEEETD